MSLAEIWDTPGYFYALGYTMGTAMVLLFEGDGRAAWRRRISLAVLAAFLIPFSIATKGVMGVPFVLSMMAMVGAILGCVYLNLGQTALALFDGIKAFIYGEFSASLCWQIYYGLALNRPALQRWLWRDAIMLGAFAAIMGVLYGLERSLHRDRPQLIILPRDLAVEALIAASVYVVSNLGYLNQGGLFSGSYARDVFTIRTLVDLSGVAMIYALHRQLIELQIRLENDALHQIMQTQYQAYQLTRQSMDTVNQKYHDLKHQIALLKAQAQSGKALSWLGEMEEEIRAYEAQNQTGSPVLDAILTNKSGYCQKHGIELKVIADGKLLNFINDMELSALFGNMLDNAIEGVERNADEGERLIRLYVDREKRFLRIRMENVCRTPLQFRDGLPVTTKGDRRYHGFGMKSMQQTVAKYSGSMLASQSGGWFRLNILIPLDSTVDA